MTAAAPLKPSVLLVLVLWVAGLGAAAQFAKMSVLLAELSALFPDAGPEIGLLVSLIGFLGIGLGLFAGLMVAEIGFRRALISALLLGAVLSAYQATLPSFPMMLASRLLEGISHLVVVVAAPTLIANASSDRYRSTAMTLWSTFFGVSFALVSWFGVPLVARYGLPALFSAHAALMLASAAALALLLPGHRLQQQRGPRPGIAGIITEHVKAYRSPFVSAAALGWLFYTLTFVSLLTILPDLVSPEDRIFVSGTMPLASIAASLTLGALLLRHFSAVKVIVTGFALALCVVPFLWTDTVQPWVAIALFAVLGLVQGASFAAVPQLNTDTTTQVRANGALAQMGNLGNTVGTPLILALLASFGMSGLIWAVAGCYIAAIAIHLALAWKREKTQHGG